MKSFNARVCVCVLALVTGALAANAGAKDFEGGYAIVVSQQTKSDPAWLKVVDALAHKHKATVIHFSNSVDEAFETLRTLHPRYACFVARPEETGKAFVARVHQLTRRLDDDPYADCFWGILTGYDASNALRIAQQSKPLTVRKVAGGTELAMDMVVEGEWYCELNRNKAVKKAAGRTAAEFKCPDDTTELLVKSLNDYKADMFVTSGHATERDWMIGYSYRNGYFKHENGRLFGEDMAGKRFWVDAPNPKIYLPIGNCLMGHIPGPDCMATAWMNSAGVCQMLGYTVPTWYGYAGWGVLDYFVEQPGRYTFTEAFFANQNALIHRLLTYFPESASQLTNSVDRTSVRHPLGDKAKADGLTEEDRRGLLFDRDVVAFYGDPAWCARMADRPRLYEQSLTRKGDRYVFVITPNRETDSFKAVNKNGVQRGGRPMIEFLPHRVIDARILEGAELNPVIADDFILVPNPRVCDPKKAYRVVFTAKRD